MHAMSLYNELVSPFMFNCLTTTTFTQYSNFLSGAWMLVSVLGLNCCVLLMTQPCEAD